MELLNTTSKTAGYICKNFFCSITTVIIWGLFSFYGVVCSLYSWRIVAAGQLGLPLKISQFFILSVISLLAGFHIFIFTLNLIDDTSQPPLGSTSRSIVHPAARGRNQAAITAGRLGRHQEGGGGVLRLRRRDKLKEDNVKEKKINLSDFQKIRGTRTDPEKEGSNSKNSLKYFLKEARLEKEQAYMGIGKEGERDSDDDDSFSRAEEFKKIVKNKNLSSMEFNKKSRFSKVDEKNQIKVIKEKFINYKITNLKKKGKKN